MQQPPISSVKAIALAIIIFSSLASADYQAITIGGSTNSESTDSSVFEINYYNQIDDHMSAYAGYAYVRPALKPEYASLPQESFHGIHGGFLVHIDAQHFRPYFGLGLYSGQRAYCDTRQNVTFQDPNDPFIRTNFNCPVSSILAIYPEVGFQFKSSKNLMLSVKARYYEYDRQEFSDETVSLFSATFSF
ncbi:MAG: hypothetical protein V2I33_08990 [Kangiellaceae bacterium]|jgi:hypothetical protein|nr:hypothetical protein [Kangiellaceae bacterium]